MNALSLVLRIVAVLAAAAAVYFYMDVKGQLETSKAKEVATQKAAEEAATAASAKQADMEKQLATAKQEKADTDTRLSDARSRVGVLEGEVAKAKADLTAAKQESRDKDAEMTGLRSRVSSMMVEIDELKKMGSPAELNAKIAELQTQVDTLSQELAAAQSATKTVVDPATGKTVVVEADKALVIDGVYKVLYTDKGHKQLVLSLGKNNGLKTGMVLALTRNDAPYADAVVLDASEADMTVVRVVGKTLLRVGDEVKITSAE